MSTEIEIKRFEDVPKYSGKQFRFNKNGESYTGVIKGRTLYWNGSSRTLGWDADVFIEGVTYSIGWGIHDSFDLSVVSPLYIIEDMRSGSVIGASDKILITDPSELGKYHSYDFIAETKEGVTIHGIMHGGAAYWKEETKHGWHTEIELYGEKYNKGWSIGKSNPAFTEMGTMYIMPGTAKIKQTIPETTIKESCENAFPPLSILPAYYAVKTCDHPLWLEYIQYLNKVGGGDYEGSGYRYYGFDGEANGVDELEEFDKDVTLITLEQWDKMTKDDPIRVGKKEAPISERTATGAMSAAKLGADVQLDTDPISGDIAIPNNFKNIIDEWIAKDFPVERRWAPTRYDALGNRIEDSLSQIVPIPRVDTTFRPAGKLYARLHSDGIDSSAKWGVGINGAEPTITPKPKSRYQSMIDLI